MPYFLPQQFEMPDDWQLVLIPEHWRYFKLTPDDLAKGVGFHYYEYVPDLDHIEMGTWQELADRGLVAKTRPTFTLLNA